MSIHVTFKNFPSSPAVRTAAETATEKVLRFVGSEVEFNWVFFVEADQHVAEVRAHGPHVDVFAMSKTEDMYGSIEDAAAKLEKQLRKQKEMVKDHLHRSR